MSCSPPCRHGLPRRGRREVGVSACMWLVMTVARSHNVAFVGEDSCSKLWSWTMPSGDRAESPVISLDAS